MAVSKTVFHAFYVAGVALLLMLMLAGFLVYTAPHFGWRVDGLRSGSMYPQLKTGDMVVTRPVATQTVSVGDIIVFRSVSGPEYLLCHRVIGIETTPPVSFSTKGDANISADPFTVPAENLVGELAFSIPLLGYPVLLLKTGAGLVASLIIPGIIVTVVCLRILKAEMAKGTFNRTPDQRSEK